jgi:hypothetical protein
MVLFEKTPKNVIDKSLTRNYPKSLDAELLKAENRLKIANSVITLNRLEEINEEITILQPQHEEFMIKYLALQSKSCDKECTPDERGIRNKSLCKNCEEHKVRKINEMSKKGIFDDQIIVLENERKILNKKLSSISIDYEPFDLSSSITKPAIPISLIFVAGIVGFLMLKK